MKRSDGAMQWNGDFAGKQPTLERAILNVSGCVAKTL